MPTDKEIPTHLNMRIDPKLRYLADLAARARNITLTEYVEASLKENFRNVTLRLQPEPEPNYSGSDGSVVLPQPLDPKEEATKNHAMSIEVLADLLWNDSEFRRIQSLSILAPHLLSEGDAALLQYVHGRKDLHIPTTRDAYKLDRDKIEGDWKSIKTAFAKKWGGNK